MGLQRLQPGTDIVAVHDGVRPFVPVEDIENVVQQANVSGAAILGVPIVETVKHAKREFVESTLTREHLVLAQTPQVFRTDILKQAFELAAKDEYYGTDESSLVERLGTPVAIVRGSDRNIKITRPNDLTLARAFLAEEAGEKVAP
jgi:2-C-methyl-D-erythritol 4-phosphate cytidylyltransferase